MVVLKQASPTAALAAVAVARGFPDADQGPWKGGRPCQRAEMPSSVVDGPTGDDYAFPSGCSGCKGIALRSDTWAERRGYGRTYMSIGSDI